MFLKKIEKNQKPPTENTSLTYWQQGLPLHHPECRQDDISHDSHKLLCDMANQLIRWTLK